MMATSSNFSHFEGTSLGISLDFSESISEARDLNLWSRDSLGLSLRMVTRKGVMIKTVTRPSGVVSRKLIPIFIVLMIFFSAVSAEPPPGSPEVENSVCDTNSTPGGICDDYDSALDQTSGDHWSKISVILKMESAEQISIEVFIALHLSLIHI